MVVATFPVGRAQTYLWAQMSDISLQWISQLIGRQSQGFDWLLEPIWALV